jgi:hypothetical protein
MFPYQLGYSSQVLNQLYGKLVLEDPLDPHKLKSFVKSLMIL